MNPQFSSPSNCISRYPIDESQKPPANDDTYLFYHLQFADKISATSSPNNNHSKRTTITGQYIKFSGESVLHNHPRFILTKSKQHQNSGSSSTITIPRHQLTRTRRTLLTTPCRGLRRNRPHICKHQNSCKIQAKRGRVT